MERGPFWRAGLLPESTWEAHPVTIIANLGEPIGESRLMIDEGNVSRGKEKSRRAANLRLAVTLAVVGLAMYVGIMLKTSDYF